MAKRFTKYVTDFEAAKSVSAYVVMKGTQQVGRIQAYHGEGRTQVDVWDFTRDDDGRFQQGRAHGYGYDLFTAALRGLTVAGIVLADHSDTNANTKKLLAAYQADPERETDVRRKYWEARAVRIGARFANWSTDKHMYTSCYVDGGIDQLRRRGLAVIQAI